MMEAPAAVMACTADAKTDALCTSTDSGIRRPPKLYRSVLVGVNWLLKASRKLEEVVVKVV